MNVNYMRERRPFRFAHLLMGATFQVEGDSNLYIKLDCAGTCAANLSTGRMVEMDSCDEVIPCPDAMVIRKQ